MSNTTYPRKPNGRFKRRSKRFLKLVAITILLVIAYNSRHFLQNKIATINFKRSQNVSMTPSTSKNQSEIDKIKERANFKARMDNQAEQILLQEQIDAITKQIADLKAQQDTIEDQLATKRTESLSL